MAQKCPQDNNILQEQGNKDAPKALPSKNFKFQGRGRIFLREQNPNNKSNNRL